jgi:hypothetical protein
MAYSQKQIERYHRQKYMSTLEKTGKNIFRMFRDGTVDACKFQERFNALVVKLENTSTTQQLDSEYHKELQHYIHRLYKETCQNEAFDNAMLSNIKQAEMSNLNRLQKLKNNTAYKKEKHKQKEEDWG